MTSSKPPNSLSSVELALQIRRHCLRMVHHAQASHIGTCLSMADLLAVLYHNALRVDPSRPDWPERDRFVLSKGHGAAALYAVLAERGFFPRDWLYTYCDDGGRLAGHVTRHGVPGVDFATGSLGHGLAVACGMAMAVPPAERRRHQPAGDTRGTPVPQRVFVLLSDGECDEGSTWEAALFAPHHGLDNLVAMVDCNAIQSFGRVKDVLDLEPLGEKWRAFGWAVVEIDGHDHEAIHAALQGVPVEVGRPTVVIARTIKGKGVPFMEDELLWHYRSPDDAELAAALEEVGDGVSNDGKRPTRGSAATNSEGDA